MKLFELIQVEKFFTILDKMNRGYSIDPLKDIYRGYDKNNPHISFCQRQVFVKRTLNKWLKGKSLILYKTSEQTNIEYKQYINIVGISYELSYGTKISVSYYDYTRPVDIFNCLSIDHNNALRLEGEWSDGKIHNELLNFFVLDLPEKEFKFRCHDMSKFPKRKKKGQTSEEIMKSLETTKSFYAQTEKEAYRKRDRFLESDEFKNSELIISELIST
jgi:hypothetical protein